MSRKYTTLDFIEKASRIHNNKYDYSKVVYVDVNTKVCIICPKHGEFWQTPESHFKGVNCPFCAIEKRTTKRLVKCDNCNKEFFRHRCYDKRNNKNVFCCKKCEAEFKNLKNTVQEWKGGRISRSTGYRYIRLNGKEIGEHDLVMMRFLGRKLKKNEVVHHIDGNKLNNDIKNLSLMTRNEHTKLHNKFEKTIKQCARCGDVKVIHGRGLCARCYAYCLRNKKLNEYELSKDSKRE